MANKVFSYLLWPLINPGQYVGQAVYSYFWKRKLRFREVMRLA